MEIPPFLWMPLVVFWTGVISWLLNIQRQLGARMTRDEHSELCMTKHTELLTQLAKIEEVLQAHVKATEAHRHAVQEAINGINTRLAVIEDRSNRRRREDEENERG